MSRNISEISMGSSLNSTEDGRELLQVQAAAEAKIDNLSLSDVAKVTPDIVKQAAHKLKACKSDPVFSYSSDCFKNANDSLYEKLSIILKGFLIYVT